MIVADKIVVFAIWLFNLLTFCAAASELYILCCDFFSHIEIMYKHFGVLAYVIVILGLCGGIVWKTGNWLFSKSDQISVPSLLAFWAFLFFSYFIYMIIMFLQMGDAGPGTGG